MARFVLFSKFQDAEIKVSKQKWPYLAYLSSKLDNTKEILTFKVEENKWSIFFGLKYG